MNNELISEYYKSLTDLMNSFTLEKSTLSTPNDNLNMAIIYLSCLIDRLERMLNERKV